MPSKIENTKVILTLWEIMFIVWSGFILLSVMLTILGIFYPLITMSYLVLAFSYIWWKHQSKKLWIKKQTSSEKILLIGLIFWAVVLSSFTVPTIFGGRDEGSLSNSAILINKTHGLKEQGDLIDTFGNIYGSGKALNFPGFFYQESHGHFVLRSQFLPGYSSYLANFILKNNIFLLKFANTLPFIIFMLSFYLVAKRLTNSTRFSIIALISLASLVPLILFYKFTLSEIFFASLLWPSLHFLLKYLEKDSLDNKLFDLTYYWLIFIPLLPSIFIRIESFAIIFVLILILIFKKSTKIQLPLYQIPILLLVLLSIFSIFLFNNFFIATGRGFLNNFINLNQLTTPPLKAPTESSGHLVPKMWHNFYIIKVFYTYNLIPFFFFATLSIVRLYKEKKWLQLTPLFFLGIVVIYLINANISLDHPWMLRRFVFAILPLVILYTIILFRYYPLKYKIFNNAIILILIISNILLAIPFITFRQNANLLEQTKQLTNKFNDNDLILVGQKASGSGWSLLSAPMKNILNKKAVYFFNPNDYIKIDKKNYQNIYLLISDEEKQIYSSMLSDSKKQEAYALTNQLIKPSKNPLQFPKFTNTKITGIIYQLK